MKGKKLRGPAAGALMIMASGFAAAPASAQATALPGEDSAIQISRGDMYTIGSVEGPDWQSLGEVTAVDFDAEGNLYILDRQAHQVLVISPQGELVRRIGREGQGPGEFVMPSAMAVLDDGSVTVYDMARRNYSFLQPDGTFIRSVPTDMMADAGIPAGRTRASGGTVFTEFRGLDIDTGNPGEDPKNGDKILVRSLTSAGWNNTRAEMMNPGIRAEFMSRPGEQSISMGGGPAFMPNIDWDVLPSGAVAWIDSDRWSVKVSSAPGQIREFTRPFQPRATSARDQRDEQARRLAALEETGEGAPMMVEDVNGQRTVTRDTAAGRRMINDLTYAETVPVLAELFVDHQGRIWVRRNGARVGESGPVDVIGATGRYLGSFEMDDLPAAVSPQGYAAFQEFGE